MTLEHDDVRGLLGAYALGAVSDSERLELGEHIRSCLECAREERLLRQAADELAFVPQPRTMPAELVDRVQDAIPERRGTSRLARAAIAVAVAASLAAAALGVTSVRQERSQARVERIIASAGRRVALRPAHDFPAHGALYVAGGGRAVLVVDALPGAGASRDYQLWAIREGTPSSVAVFDGRGRLVRVLSSVPGGDVYAVTVEPRGGSQRPTTTPVLRSA